MTDNAIKKALESSRLHSKLADGIMSGEITENKVSELTDQEKLFVQSAWDCIQPFEARDIVAQHQETINCQKEENEKLISKLDELESEYALYKISAQERIESLISGQETLQKFIAKKDAEIDMLNQNIEVLAICKKDLPQITMNAIKSEAVKEFTEKSERAIFIKQDEEREQMLKILKTYRGTRTYSDTEQATDNWLRGYGEAVQDILSINNNLAKEMAGENNEN